MRWQSLPRIDAFKSVGIDAYFDEKTPDTEFTKKVRSWEALGNEQRIQVTDALIKSNLEEAQQFIHALDRAVTRQVEAIIVLPLHGSVFRWGSVEEAIAFIESYDKSYESNPIVRYEIDVRYINGDCIKGQFADKEAAIQFLRSYQPPAILPAR